MPLKQVIPVNPPAEIEEFCRRGKCTLSAVSPQKCLLRGDLRVTLSEAALEENVLSDCQV